MMGARILDGDIVFIKETSIVDNGDIAAVAIDDEVLLKRFEYFKEENILTLHSETHDTGQGDTQEKNLIMLGFLVRLWLFRVMLFSYI